MLRRSAGSDNKTAHAVTKGALVLMESMGTYKGRDQMQHCRTAELRWSSPCITPFFVLSFHNNYYEGRRWNSTQVSRHARRLSVDFASNVAGSTSAQETGVSVIGNSADVFLSASFHPHRDTSGAVSGCGQEDWNIVSSSTLASKEKCPFSSPQSRQPSERFIRRSWSSSHRHSSSDGTCRCIRP
ncbi:hypothetical protein B0H14DRAFT_1154684 [Mycena olivaceomarginata]|nr:hypothetical protein B0H14DRAFT_1154684 [Mycena olivaceomarginata]